jgi:hypothetical protein
MNRWIIAVVLSCLSFSSFSSDLNLCKAQGPSSVDACKRLSELGNADGQFGLGMLLLEGIGAPQNYKQSFKLMYDAAMQGHSAAQFQVGQAYVNGQGVNKDYIESYAWFLVSNENGNPVAERGLEFMEKNRLIEQHQMNAATQRANSIYAQTSNKKGYSFDPAESEVVVSGIKKYCEMVMGTVESIILIKKYNKPRSQAQQLMIGMTDKKSISMMNGLIEWVWSTPVPVGEMPNVFKEKCLQQSPEVSFIFP